MPRQDDLTATAPTTPDIAANAVLESATALESVNRPPLHVGSGRVRHEDKITVYVSREELLRLEQARLTLRAVHGVAVDRGRIVREAAAAALDDYARNSTDSQLLQRLTAR